MSCIVQPETVRLVIENEPCYKACVHSRQTRHATADSTISKSY